MQGPGSPGLAASRWERPASFVRGEDKKPFLPVRRVLPPSLSPGRQAHQFPRLQDEMFQYGSKTISPGTVIKMLHHSFSDEL